MPARRHHSAYLVPGSPAPQAPHRVDSHHEPYSTAPQPAHSIRRSTAGPRPIPPLSRRQPPVPTQTEPIVVPAPQVSLQDSTQQKQRNYIKLQKDSRVEKAAYYDTDMYAVPNTPPQQGTASAGASPEVGRYHRGQYMLDGGLYGSDLPSPASSYQQAWNHISASEDEQSTQSPAPPTSSSNSRQSRRSSKTFSLEAQVDQETVHPTEHGLKLTIAHVQLNEHEQAQNSVSSTVNDCPPLTSDQIRWINKYGHGPHTVDDFDTTRYVDHCDLIPWAQRRSRRGRCGSVSSMHPMDSDLLDGHVKPSLLKYVERQYTKAGQFVQGIRKTFDSMRSE
ncbi:hypothetical protein BDU57DRAFT_534738 [Ampelomyces quisqualis]|uniref:Uncharacterized protein n=1 Tax=Ampelomyces quisqualis TaxID=50730 RepID=A0A6A5R1L3_AMPQU|nr:hypothetical protein BDU57DRAFT_534738 [Ampelomyces quisqualis]